MNRTARSNRAQRLVSTSGAVIAGVGLVALGFAASVSAQTVTNSQPQTGFPNSDTNPDPFSNRGEGQSSGVMSLIHRALQGQSKGAEEFNAEQQENLDSAAAQFRAKQQELLRNQQHGSRCSCRPSTRQQVV